MLATRSFLLALLLLGSQALGRAEPSPGQAVYVDVCVAEQDAERVTKTVHEPVWESLKVLPGAGDMTGAATHGKAQFHVMFKDGATRNDRAAVERALERVEFAPDVEILSVRVELGQPRADGLFVGRPACTEHLRRGR
jgi:hypothetical protein